MENNTPIISIEDLLNENIRKNTGLVPPEENSNAMYHSESIVPIDEMAKRNLDK